jgi:hypothetical protein
LLETKKFTFEMSFQDRVDEEEEDEEEGIVPFSKT